MTTTDLSAPTTTEKQLQQAVYDCARRLGWLSYHVHDARKSTPGFPDLLLLKPPRIIVAELKTTTGKLASWQRIWLDAFERIPGVEVYVWRPAEWHAGTIEEVLR
jgi:hypothetical protein